MTEIKLDVSGHDLAETLKKARRCLDEAAQSAELDELQKLLLPLAIAVARLSARSAQIEVTQ